MRKTVFTGISYAILIFFIFVCALVSAQDVEEEEECEKVQNTKAEKLYKKAEAIAKKDKAQQVGFLKEAIQEEPDFIDAYWKLARIAMGRESYKSALKHLEKVLELCPTYDLYVHYHLGRIYYGAEEYAKAVRHMAEFMKKPDDIKADRHYNVAEQIKKDATFYGALYDNPVPFEPTNVKGICTAKDEYLPYITADQETVYFTRKFQEKALGDLFPKIVERFSVAERKNGVFERGKALPAPFNKGSNEGGACLTIDNLHMYFTICKPLSNGYNNCDIYTADYMKLDANSMMDISWMTEELDMTEAQVRHELQKLKESGSDYIWTNIRSIGENVNTIKSWESQPTISSDGKTLYFASIREGGVGGIDIYKTVKDSVGVWGKPSILGKNINTTGNEKSPFLHPDRKTLYFSSNGHRGLGGYDIFYSIMDKTESGYKWGKAHNIGYPINSEQDDLGFFCSTDGATGYFSSTNESEKYKSYGGWDLYEFPLYEGARPSEVLFLKGAIKDEEGKAITGGRMDITNVRTKETTQVNVDSASGVYAAIVTLEEDQKDGFVVNVVSENYAFSSQMVQFKDEENDEEKNGVVTKLDVALEQVTIGVAYKLDNINFATNSSSVLTVSSMIILDGFINYLKDNPDMRVAIHGHTDDVGSDEDNMKLSQGRAKSVNDYMVLSGVDDNRLSFKGFGETKAVASNKTKYGRAQNRRTEFVIESF
ncbi:MAG: OmpA family protein [Flavobacteriales bacterium]|nr:OmpA family protein [Flavobacteriales bacterium]